jgi:hypothetical protein
VQPLSCSPAAACVPPPEEAVQGAGVPVADDGCAQVDEQPAGVHHLVHRGLGIGAALQDAGEAALRGGQRGVAGERWSCCWTGRGGGAAWLHTAVWRALAGFWAGQGSQAARRQLGRP